MGEKSVAIQGFVSAYQKNVHFRKHGGEFPFATADDYEAEAVAFFVCNKPKTMVDCTRTGGDYLLYDKANNKLGVCAKDGTLRSFFRPDKRKHHMKDHMRYFRKTCKE